MEAQLFLSLYSRGARADGYSWRFFLLRPVFFSNLAARGIVLSTFSYGPSFTERDPDTWRASPVSHRKCGLVLLDNGNANPQTLSSVPRTVPTLRALLLPRTVDCKWVTRAWCPKRG